MLAEFELYKKFSISPHFRNIQFTIFVLLILQIKTWWTSIHTRESSFKLQILRWCNFQHKNDHCLFKVTGKYGQLCSLTAGSCTALWPLIFCFCGSYWQTQKKIFQGILDANRYTKLENLAWSQTVFLQFTFCRKRRFMKPSLLSSIAIFIHNTGCLF